MLPQELLTLLQQYAGTSSSNPGHIELSRIEKDLDTHELLCDGYLIVNEKNGEIWITQQGLEELGLPFSPNPEARRMEGFVAAVWNGILRDPVEMAREKAERAKDREQKESERIERHRKQASARAERDACLAKERMERRIRLRAAREKEIQEQVRHLAISVNVLKDLVPGDYISSEDIDFPFQSEGPWYYRLITTKEFYNELRNYIEDREEEYFGINEDSEGDERSFMIRTPEEVLSNPDALELIALNCFFLSDDGGIVFKDDDYVVLRTSSIL